MSNRLGRELFERDRDAYFQSMAAAIEGKAPSAIPAIGLNVALGLVETVLPGAGLKKAVKRWRGAIAETMGVAYVVAVDETWDELDRDRARRLLDEMLAYLLRVVPGRSADRADAAELHTAIRVEKALRGLGSSVPEAAALRDYIVSQGGYRRLNEFKDLFVGMGRVMDNVKPKQEREYSAVCEFAWDQGLHLGVLHIIGEI
ncbi:MAG TPA: hypothetical protein VI409_06750 [Gaiellaceae bacterium]|nr:hypothetical protein [Gaiellaceae bacterium]